MTSARVGRGRRPRLCDSELLTLAVAQVLLGYHSERRRFYWGLKLYLLCTGDGMPLMWCLAHPKLGEREVVAALLEHNHLIRTGQVLLADKGFSGTDFTQLTEAMELRLLRPDRKDETYRNGNLGGVRQWIASVNQTLKGQLDLEGHGGRTPVGVFTRVAQRLLALAAGATGLRSGTHHVRQWSWLRETPRLMLANPDASHAKRSSQR